jgi:hypothetical protein
MKVQFLIKLSSMFLALFSVIAMNFILFKAIQKTIELKINGVQSTAQIFNKSESRLKFSVGDQVFYFRGKISADESAEPDSEVKIIYNKNSPSSAATLSQYKFLDSFLGLMIIAFLVLGIAIWGFLKKIRISLKTI